MITEVDVTETNNEFEIIVTAVAMEFAALAPDAGAGLIARLESARARLSSKQYPTTALDRVIGALCTQSRH